MVVEFPAKFNGDNRNPFLKQKLITPSEKSGILNRLLFGFTNYDLFGLPTSKLMNNERDSYLADNDLLTAFIEDYCILEEGATVKRKDLLAHVKAHGAFDLRSRPDKDIINAFARHSGITYRRSKQGFVFDGIRLADGDDQ